MAAPSLADIPSAYEQILKDADFTVFEFVKHKDLVKHEDDLQEQPMALYLALEGNKHLSVAQLTQLLKLVRTDCRSLEELWGAARHHAHLHREALPDLSQLPCVRIDGLSTEGLITMGDNWAGECSDVLERGKSIVGNHGRLVIQCYYTAKGSPEIEDTHDHIGLRLQLGKCFLENESIGNDYDRKKLFAEMIHVLDLH